MGSDVCICACMHGYAYVHVCMGMLDSELRAILSYRCLDKGELSVLCICVIVSVTTGGGIH